MDSLGIALLGCGTVGTGVVKLLLEEQDRLASRAGRKLELRYIVTRTPDRPRIIDLPQDILTTTPIAAFNDPKVDVVLELIGGTTIAKDFVLAALRAGKHVVTANKALLAEHGTEIFEVARQYNKTVCFEAAVAGGIPIIAAMMQSLSSNQITGLQGILNGTSNFILSKMADTGASYDSALAEAQKLGYAEADPTLDVDGSDAAHKLAILAQIAFGITVTLNDIERQGINGIHAMDIRYAGEFGYTIKLLAEAWLDHGAVALHVAPVLVRNVDSLARVHAAFNAIQVFGDAVGEVLFQGPGAGMMPTASSVVADIIDLAVGRAHETFHAAKLWSTEKKHFTLRSSENVKSRFYMRILIEDRPGMLAEVARVLATHDISIASVIQHEALEEHQGQVVPLVIMTHYAPTGRFRMAMNQINHLKGIIPPGVYYSVDD
jgi:homoserine dehydrogenase